MATSILCFVFSGMGAGKTMDLLRIAYNCNEQGIKPWLLTSSVDNRHGIGRITSRSGFQQDARPIDQSDNIYNLFVDENSKEQIDVVLVDEAMFLSNEQVWQLAKIVDDLGISVTCFGLRSDFQGNLFEGSAALMAIADEIKTIDTRCRCGEKAIMNARIKDEKIVREGAQVQIGGNESYKAMCRKCWGMPC
ncbi:thymidine kinase [Patescibacteria group bacterium]|nr:thymidine kinase [Patescibacteria group bacterium]